MNGILNILKPPGMTSFDVISYLRGLLKQKKIGHAGTLDPGAVGVLPVCIGNATKAIDYMIDKDKIYRAELTLGISTDTQDSFGKPISIKQVNIPDKQIIKVIGDFKGKYLQTPPMYSAIKINGKKLYELARKGIEIEREPREVEILDINIVHLLDNKVIFDVHCSKGTYVRTLCADIGEKLGCGAHMSFLIRTVSGMFDISSALTLEEISFSHKTGNLKDKIINVDRVFENLQSIKLNELEEKRFLNGVSIDLHRDDLNIGDIYRIYGVSGKFIAIGEILYRDNRVLLKTKKNFNG